MSYFLMGLAIGLMCGAAAIIGIFRWSDYFEEEFRSEMGLLSRAPEREGAPVNAMRRAELNRGVR